MEHSHTVEKRTDTITMFPQWVELYTLILSETKKLIYRHSREPHDCNILSSAFWCHVPKDF